MSFVCIGHPFGAYSTGTRWSQDCESSRHCRKNQEVDGTPSIALGLNRSIQWAISAWHRPEADAC